MSETQSLVSRILPSRSKPHYILTAAIAVFSAILLVGIVISGDIIGGLLTLMIVPALCLVRAKKVRSGRKWIVAASLTSLALAASGMTATNDNGSVLNPTTILIVVYYAACILWGEMERKFQGRKRFGKAKSMAEEARVPLWFVAEASPSGSQTRVVLSDSDGQENWSTSVWGTARTGMMLILNDARQIQYWDWR
jgi:hypothetical protein